MIIYLVPHIQDYNSAYFSNQNDSLLEELAAQDSYKQRCELFYKKMITEE